MVIFGNGIEGLLDASTQLRRSIHLVQDVERFFEEVHRNLRTIFDRHAFPTGTRGYYCSHVTHSEHWRTGFATLRCSSFDYKNTRGSISLP
jgi:hypothetical protein